MWYALLSLVFLLVISSQEAVIGLLRWIAILTRLVTGQDLMPFCGF
jgi:hypothetical protein